MLVTVDHRGPFPPVYTAATTAEHPERDGNRRAWRGVLLSAGDACRRPATSWPGKACARAT